MAEGRISIDNGLTITLDELQKRAEAGEGVRQGDGRVDRFTFGNIEALQGAVHEMTLVGGRPGDRNKENVRIGDGHGDNKAFQEGVLTS